MNENNEQGNEVNPYKKWNEIYNDSLEAPEDGQPTYDLSLVLKPKIPIKNCYERVSDMIPPNMANLLNRVAQGSISALENTSKPYELDEKGAGDLYKRLEDLFGPDSNDYGEYRLE